MLGSRLRSGPSGRRFSTRHATRLAKGSVMSWLILILSGALEAVWAAALHRTFQASGRRRLAPALLFLVSVLASMAGLAIAMQSIPTGTAYAVWVGVGV